MTRKQVVEKLIPIYMEAINRIADGEDIVEVLCENNTGYGICSCYIYKYGTILKGDWVKEICTDTHWYNMPMMYDTVFEALECLSYRLTIMEFILMDENKK